MATLDDEYLTLDELSAALKVPKSRCYFWTHTKQLPVYRLGFRTVRVRKADVEAFLASKKEEANGSELS